MKFYPTSILVVLALAAALFTGCGEIKNTLKHVHSSFTGLSRTITLYNANGGVINVWHTRAKVEDNGGTCYFLDNNDKAVTISGTFIIQEN